MRQDGRWQSTSTLADLIRLAQSGKCGDDGGLVASGWRPAVASPDEVRGYAKDAAPRGKHAVEKARWGEGAFDEMYDSAYDSADDSESDAAADAAPLKGKRKRAKGAKQRLAQALGEGLVFWCALCDMAKPLQSLKAIEAHRKGKKSCVRGPAGKRTATLDELSATGFLFFSEAPSQPTSAASRSRGRAGGGCGGGKSSGRGGSGRGNKSAATKMADKARVAALMAARKEVERAGGSWDPLRGCAVADKGAQPDDGEVECLGHSTRAEAESARHAAGRQVAVDLDEE